MYRGGSTVVKEMDGLLMKSTLYISFSLSQSYGLRWLLAQAALCVCESP